MLAASIREEATVGHSVTFPVDGVCFDDVVVIMILLNLTHGQFAIQVRWMLVTESLPIHKESRIASFDPKCN